MFLSMFISCLFLSTFITCSPRTHSPFYMPYCASYATYITLHPLYVPYSIYTSHLWVFPAPILPIHPPRGFSPLEASLYAHFSNISSSSLIISGFFRPPPLPYAHHVGFLPGKLLSTPISPTSHTLRTSSLGFSALLPRFTPTAWVFSPESFSLRPFRQHRLASYPFSRQKFPSSLAISQGTLYTTYRNHTISKHTMIWIYIVLSVSGNIHMFGT